MKPIVDTEAIRQACEPIARWWHDTQQSGHPDPEQLRKSVGRAKLLGPIPGPLGAALAYILDGCPDLNYPKVHAAFSRVAAAGLSGPTPDDLDQGAVGGVPLQLCLAGMPAPTSRTPRKRKSNR